MEKLWTETKRINIGLPTLKSTFVEYDTQRQGVVYFSDFVFAIEQRLRLKGISQLDMKVIGRRYRAQAQSSSSDDLVSVDRFY